MKVSEQIVLDSGEHAGSWLYSGQKSYELVYTVDSTNSRGRLHHLAFLVDTREEILRAADIYIDNDIYIEGGPAKHAIQQTFFLYCYEPGGNRIEVCTGAISFMRRMRRPSPGARQNAPEGRLG